MHNRVRMNIQYASLGRRKYFEVGRTIEIFMHDNFRPHPLSSKLRLFCIGDARGHGFVVGKE